MKRKKKTSLPLLAAGGVAVGGALLYTEFMTTVIARRRSRLLSRLSRKSEDDVPGADVIRASDKAMRALPTEAVTITARDGTRLCGHWYHTDAPKRMIIMVHGWHSTWSINFGISAPFYHGNDCELLYVEQRCHGNSEGDLISYGIKERFDVLDWLDYVRSVRTDLPIYLCGLSMGATTVLMAAGEPIADRVSAVIADCGYTSPYEIVSRTVEKTLGNATAPTVAAVDLNCRLRGHFSLNDYSTLTAMERNTEIPVLFIHGDEDDFVPCRMSMENYLACRAPRELLLVHGAHHATAYLQDTDAYQSRVLAFFAAWDGRLNEKAANA